MGKSQESTEEQRLLTYIRVLFTDMAVLHSLLLELAPGQVVCHDWDMLGDEEQATKIAAFIAPNDFFAGYIKSTLMTTARSRPTTLDRVPYEGAAAIITRLQQKLDAFESVLCGPKQIL